MAGATEHNAAGGNSSRETERLALQRKRSIAIAVSLGLLVVLFYVATLVKMGGNGNEVPAAITGLTAGRSQPVTRDLVFSGKT